jgi:probable phosphoglycerate mutase
MTSRLIIVRHGNTFSPGDVVTRVGGRTDLPLSPSGLDQAKALGVHFARDFAFASAHSSPLKRTWRTASIILDFQNAAPELETGHWLREIDYGPDENRPEAEVLARIGQGALDAWEQDFTPPPGWRIDPAAVIGNWQQLFSSLAKQPGDHLVVTSNGIARFALSAANATGQTGKLPTGGYGVIDLEDGATRVMTWGRRPPA